MEKLQYSYFQIKFYLTAILLVTTALCLTGCQPETSGASTGGNATVGGDAATVNGKAIKNEAVETAIKQIPDVKDGKVSPLELAQARLQALQGMIQEEVLYQKAETEKALPSDDDLTQAVNQFKQSSGLTADDLTKQLQDAGENEQSLREKIRRQLAIKKLQEKIASTVEPPKDSEVEAFFKGNPQLFINKRGASFAAIVIDPKGNGQTTKTPEEAQLKLKEVGQKLSTPGIDFAELARQYSEDPNSAARGGDFQAFSEADMKQIMTPELADYIMNKMQIGQVVPRIVPFEGKAVFLKLTALQKEDENLTLESPNIKQRVIELLTNAKKQLLVQAYQVRAIDEARVVNNIAKFVVDNPNNLSGARPAPDPNASPSPSASPTGSATPSASPAKNAVAQPAKGATKK